MEEIKNDTQDVDLENNEGAVETPEEDESDDVDPSERIKQLEADVAKYKRIAKRNANKPTESDSEEKEVPKNNKKPEDLDYGQKAFLRSWDIKGADEVALVKDWVRRTGEELDSIVEDDIFQSRLAKLREARASTEAVPKGKGRTQQTATVDDVSYWQAKIAAGQATMHDVPDVALRRKVLNARIEQEQRGNRFSDSPIQMNL
jgi:hypothetical protein